MDWLQELTQYRPTVELKFYLQNSVPPSSTVPPTASHSLLSGLGTRFLAYTYKESQVDQKLISTNLIITSCQPCRPHRPVLFARWLLTVTMTFNSTTSPAALAMTEV